MAKKKIQTAKPTTGTPVGDRVLVRRFGETEAGTTSEFGIILPDSAKSPAVQGEVIAVGPGKKTATGVIPMTLKVGDVIIFSQYGHDELSIGGKNYLLMKEDTVLLILT